MTTLSIAAATVPTVIATRLLPAAGIREYVNGAPTTAAVAGEHVTHVLGELSALAVLDDPDRLLAAAWLASLRSAPYPPRLRGRPARLAG
jgi:hypothetical protein